MDNIPPLNLSTSIKIQDSQQAEGEHLKHITRHDNKDAEYMFVQYGFNQMEDVITITGEPVSDNCKINVKEENSEDDSSCNKQTASDGLVSDQQTKGNFSQKTKIDKASRTNKLYQCTTCSESFSRANQLRHHEKLHITKKELCCDACSEKFETEEELLTHKSANHTVQVVIPDGNICVESVVEACVLPKNPSVKYNCFLKKYNCPECGMSFSREVYLTTHLRKHTGEKPYECDVCHARFKQMSHLTTHVRTHTLDRPYSCNLCNASFSQTGSLRRHFRSHTGEKPFKCDECDALFVEKRNLSRHKLSHSGERPFKCDMCPSSFTQLIDLKRHKLSHFGIKPFKCDLCGGSFSRKNNLRWHRLTHEGQTPYKCDICNVGFRLARDLKTHKQSHSQSQTDKSFLPEKYDIKPSEMSTLPGRTTVNSEDTLLCNLCGEIFYTEIALMKHIRKHDGDKKFPCDLCPMSFTHKKPLRKHKIVVHNETRTNKINKVNPIVNVISDNVKDVDQRAVIDDESNLLKQSSISNCQPLKENMDTITSDVISSVFMSPAEKSASGEQSTLVLTQPGLPPKTGRPAGNCQNHDHHIQTMTDGVYDQWQVWCFCEIPDVPATSASITSYGYPSTSSNTVTLSATRVTSTVSDTQMQRQMVDEINYSNTEFESDIRDYLSERNNTTADGISSDDLTHADEACPIEVKCNLPDGIDTTGASMKSSAGESLHDKPIHDVVFNNDALKNNSPINLSDCNNTRVEVRYTDISHQSDDGLQLQSKNGTYFDKDATGNSYLLGPESNDIGRQNHNTDMGMDVNGIAVQESDLITESNNIPFPSNSIATVDSSEKMENLSFGNHSKLALSTHKLNDKIFINSEFSSAFLSDEISKKSITDQPQIVAENGASFSKEAKKSFSSDFPTFESVFQEFESDVCNDKGVPLQYCLTVNNPATGDIQVQSDLFPKQNQNTTPIKKRKLSSTFEPSKSNPKRCPFCSKSFSKQNTLDYHIKTHTGEKSMVCGICHQTFTHKNTLMVHIRNHTGERPYMCTLCNASFAQKSNLAVHHRTHTGERPFSCNLCESTFSQGSHLKAHKRIHFNHRPYVCKTCDHAFTQKSALTRHEGKHNSKRNLKCRKCSAVFTSKELLRQHAVSHKEKPPAADDDARTKSKSKKVPVLRKDESLPIGSQTVIEDILMNQSTTNDVANQSASLTNMPIKSDMPVPKLKHRPAILQPTRRSRRILESASKKSSNKESDFITGDLDEIDRAEETENQLVAVKPRQYRKKPNSAEVNSWCFCEVAHGPNEPHTNIQEQTTAVDPVSEQPKCANQTNQMATLAETSDTVYQLSIPNLSHAIVLQGAENSLPIRNDDIILDSNGADHPQLPIAITSSSSDFSDTQFSSLNIPDDQRLLNDSLRRTDNRAIFGPSPVSQVYTARPVVTPEGSTLYTLDPEVLSTETVILNSSAGTIFFEVSPDGQMLALPMQEPIVVGSVNDIQNTINLSGSSSELGVTPASLGLPAIGGMEPTRVDPEDEKGMATFNSSNVVAAVDFVPLGNNFMDMLDDNLDFDTLKSNVSSRPSRKKAVSIVVLPSQCVLCGKEFAQKSTLYAHMTESHSDYLYCNHCFKVFITRDELVAHKLEHLPEIVCNLCNAVFDSKSQLNRHRTETHNVPRVKREIVNCEPCGITFTQVTDFKRHMQSHLGIKPFVCKECGASFTRKSSMNKHERLHTGEKPYTCADCSKSFIYRYQFNRHRASPCTY